jgi:hypothetical protein
MAKQIVIKSNLETYIPEQFESVAAARAELRRKAEFARPLVGVVEEGPDTLALGNGAVYHIAVVAAPGGGRKGVWR